MNRFEVAVIGSGIAGMAAAIHLARAGMQVVCVEDETMGGSPVGESLDWSAPDLLAELGLPTEQLLRTGMATYKHHVIIKLLDGTEHNYIPGEWLGGPPIRANLSTLHVDRVQLNDAIRAIMIGSGVQILKARIARIESLARRIMALHTAEGDSIAARWYIDASGGKASLFPRHFELPVIEYGPHKVAMWDYFRVSSLVEGTTLHSFSGAGGYMEWVWQIPIHRDMVSVGYVASGDSIREQRREGESVEGIFARQLGRFSGLRPFVEEQAAVEPPRTTSFRCRVCKDVTGPNWIAIGEAAAMVDPMTSNGVTAALRQASEATAMIVRYRNSTRLGALAARTYSWRVTSVARFFNCGIEKVAYEWPVRAKIGTVRAGDVYTIPAWVMNLVYSRLRPRGMIKTALLAGILLAFRGGFNALSWYCRRTASAEAACAT